MSKQIKSDSSVDRIAEDFYRPFLNMSTGVFSDSALQVRKIFKDHKAKPVPVIPRCTLDGPSVSWKVFKRLNQATEYADSYTKDCMVFSYEEKLPESSGQRLFLVTHPQHLWLNHKPRPLHERCTYEVIREDAPCKLYFDLEFNKTFNPGIDGIKMTEIFIKCIIASLFEEYNLELSTESFLWLDSSTDQKYSCHLILQMPDTAFLNNIQAGYFVCKMLANIKRRIEMKVKSNNIWPSFEVLEYLLVKNANDRSAIFCDDGVYTKNRNFRLFLSTKFGKTTPLLLSEKNQYKPKFKKHCGIEDIIFYDSLVTYFRNGNKFKRLLSCDQSFKSGNVCRNNLSSKLKSGFSGVPPNISPSPYAEVDEFVSSIVKDGVTTGFIRRWSYLDSEEVIIYDIGSYRYCGRIGRHHKSNNIMIIVDMKRKTFYQKCHDPECRAQGYKSQAKSLPDYIAALYNVPDDFFDTDCFSQLPNKSIAHTSIKTPVTFNGDVVTEEHQIADDFLEDLSLDSYPFTQLCAPESKILRIPNSSDNSEVENGDVHALEVSFAADTSFDDLCMEDLESEFATQPTKNGPETTVNAHTCNEALPENNGDMNPENNGDMKSNAEEMSSEDEFLMAEAASAIEVSFSDSMFSEETIF